MRYAIVRGGGGLPPLEDQYRRLTPDAYDVALEEAAPTRKGQSSLMRQLRELDAGDEVILWSLDALQLPTSDLLTLVLRFFQVGVTVRLIGPPATETLSPANGPPRALSLLAEHEARWPSRAPNVRRARNAGRPLSPYQLKYARQMLRRGSSLRAVGLLFQLAPDELSHLLAASNDKA